MKKTQMVSYRDIDKIIGKPATATELRFPKEDGSEEDVVVLVRPYISLDEMRQLVLAVVDNLFDEEGGYHPEVRQQAEALQIIHYFTNIKLDFDASGTVTEKTMDRLGRMMYGSDLYRRITDVISRTQYSDMVHLIQNSIAHRRAISEADHNAYYRQMAARLDRAVEAMEKFAEPMSEVTPDEMKGILRRFASEDPHEVNRTVIRELVSHGALGSVQ